MLLPLTLAPQLAPATKYDHKASLSLRRHLNAEAEFGFINAFRGLAFHRDARYVEGLAVPYDRSAHVYEHGWLQATDGSIIDPTPGFARRNGAPAVYFEVHHWSREEVVALALEEGEGFDVPLCQYLPTWGQDSERWVEARLAAFRQVSAMTLVQRGVPLCDDEHEAAQLEALIGRYWMRQLGLAVVDPSQRYSGAWHGDALNHFVTVQPGRRPSISTKAARRRARRRDSTSSSRATE